MLPLLSQLLEITGLSLEEKTTKTINLTGFPTLKLKYMIRFTLKARLEKRPFWISRCSSGSLIITTSTWCCLKFHLQSIRFFYIKLEKVETINVRLRYASLKFINSKILSWSSNRGNFQYQAF